jgi:triacylglycerol esterase/lipase EstA (alpha/beta hydrolase family)
MFSKKIILFAFAAMAALSSCTKDDAAADNTALLTTGKWKITAETTAGVNTFTTKPACEKDNTFAFATDGKVAFDEGATKCDPTDPQTSTGTWAFSGTEKKKVILTESGFAITCDITELTATSLKWSYTNPFDNKIVAQTFGK